MTRYGRGFNKLSENFKILTSGNTEQLERLLVAF